MGEWAECFILLDSVMIFVARASGVDVKLSTVVDVDSILLVMYHVSCIYHVSIINDF